MPRKQNTGHTIITQPTACTVDTRQVEAVDPYCWCQTPTLPSASFIKPPHVFPVFDCVVLMGLCPLWPQTSVLGWEECNPTVFCCCDSFASRLDVWRMLSARPIHRSCKKWPFVRLQPFRLIHFLSLLTSWIYITPALAELTRCLLVMFFFFFFFPEWAPEESLRWPLKIISRFRNTRPIWRQKPRHVESRWGHIWSPFVSWPQYAGFVHVALLIGYFDWNSAVRCCYAVYSTIWPSHFMYIHHKSIIKI